VTPLAESVGLKMMTPETFLDAESEGTDPTAADKSTIDQQISGKQIKIYVYNTQNSNPDVVDQVNKAKAQGIPVAEVTETLAPANASFQDWQVKELQGIEDALKQATGK
jgi:zinc/manganese transport system substrate-binding protein